MDWTNFKDVDHNVRLDTEMTIQFLILDELENCTKHTSKVDSGHDLNNIAKYINRHYRNFIVLTPYRKVKTMSELILDFAPRGQVSIIHAKHNVMFLKSCNWYICLSILRPDQLSKQVNGPLLYVEFSWNRQQYISPGKFKHDVYQRRMPGRKLYQDDHGIIFAAAIPGIYGWGYGPSGPYRYYFLHTNGQVSPVDHRAQNLWEPLPSTCPTKAKVSISTFVDITSDFPDECPICFEQLSS